MPKIDQDMQNFSFGAFNFSGTRPDKLPEMKYTIVCIVTDMTGSVDGFEDELLKMEKQVIRDAQKASFQNNVIFRVVRFNAGVGTEELYGFKPVKDIDIDQDHPPFSPNWQTPLIDASFDGIQSVMEYGKTLHNDEFDELNGLVVLTTDGDENASKRATFDQLKRLISEYKKSESLDSLKTILIGINTSGVNYVGRKISDILAEFKEQSGIDQYLDAGDVQDGVIGKIAGFISASVSSTSQALGTGSPSQNLEF